MRHTNKEILNNLIDYSDFGAFSQVFIIEAIRSYAGNIVAQGQPVDHGSSFISEILWYNLAKDTLHRLNIAYSENRS